MLLRVPKHLQSLGLPYCRGDSAYSQHAASSLTQRMSAYLLPVLQSFLTCLSKNETSFASGEYACTF